MKNKFILILIAVIVAIILIPIPIKKLFKIKYIYGNINSSISNNKNYLSDYSTEENTVIYYIPHPDDETLSMGIPILNDIKNKKNVQVVLFTEGEDSGAISNINTKIDRYHIIFRKYHVIDRRDMANARVVEFMRASLILGIKPKNIHFENFRSGKLTELECKQTMLKYKKMFPNSACRTTSTFDVNPDHRHLGQALFKLHKEGIIKDAAFFLSPEEWDKTIYGKINNIVTPIDMKKIEEPIKGSNPNLTLAFVDALNSYNLWNPTDADYAVGYNSVKDYFDNVTKCKISMLIPVKDIKVIDEGPIAVPPYRTYLQNTMNTIVKRVLLTIQDISNLWLKIGNIGL
ncbi:PIG-L family deacetylase [Clostridium tyrobutyricum]|uniref:PIG-L deacetylase family protein n=1 Tax=Clostridium tyrobutyricum TaxID=1519 RepID=UPI001C393304|nr:PIG-L family deacetylase [Clostridium tyrobutyricum]MBV4419562.1 PIG-L family deacetylase [Clostridium tyrobutyricum]